MRGGERHEVERNGRSYVLYHTDTMAEVIRLGYARPGEHAAIRTDMVDMIPVVTGCRVDESSVKGDSGEIRAKLRCKPPG